MKTVICCSLVAVSLVACHRDREKAERERPVIEQQLKDPNDQDRAGTTFLTGASWIANEVAIDRIARARCAREMTCDAVGPNKHFVSGDVCLQETRHDVTSNLKVSECPAGVDGAELDACVNAIRDEACDKSVDARSRVAACRSNKLCLRVEMPHR
jgi:hypothetical protein